MQVSRLNNGDNVVNGVLSRDVAMVGSQLPGQQQPVHACGHGVNDECEREEGNRIVRMYHKQCKPQMVDGCYM